MGAGRRHQSYCGSKQQILDRLDWRNDPNASIAFDEMVADGLMECYLGKYLKNFDKRAAFDALVVQESEEELAKTQPLQDESAGMIHRFTRGSKSQSSNQRIHYYYVLEKDPQSWVVLVKTRAAGRAGRLKMGSFENPGDKLAKLWAASKLAAKNNRGQFIRFDVEKIDLEAAGTSREYSRAAMNIFKELGLIKIVGYRNRAEVYALTEREPVKANLDRYTKEG